MFIKITMKHVVPPPPTSCQIPPTSVDTLIMPIHANTTSPTSPALYTYLPTTLKVLVKAYIVQHTTDLHLTQHTCTGR